MSIEASIAHALHKDLDILEADPNVITLPVRDLEGYIDSYIVGLQQKLLTTLQRAGEPYIKSRDAAGLCATCLQEGIELPTSMLLRICQTIMSLTHLDARFIAEDADGTPIYYVRMEA